MAEQVTNYQCPLCTGPLHFSSETGKLECEYCDNSFSVEEIEKFYARKDEKAAQAAAEAEQEQKKDEQAAPEAGDANSGWDLSSVGREWGTDADGVRVYNCPSCGAELICDDTTAATACPYDHVMNGLLYSDINDYLNSGAWDGDLSEDAYALSVAVETFVNKMYSYYAPDRVPEGGDCVLPRSGRSHVFDTAGLIKESAQDELEEAAEALQTKYDFGVYIVTVDDFRDYSTNNVFHAALNIYNANNFGVGAEKNGLLLLLSMEDRDLNLMTNGPYGEYAFNDAGREYMTDFFVDDFGEDRWYDGFVEYLTWADRYLEKAEEGTPYSAENEPWDSFSRNFSIIVLVLLILAVPLIPACIFQSILDKMMKSVEKGTEASAYVSQRLKLTKQDDKYTRTTKTRRYNPPEDKSDSGGGGSSGVTHERSGSASGTSRKF